MKTKTILLLLILFSGVFLTVNYKDIKTVSAACRTECDEIFFGVVCPVGCHYSSVNHTWGGASDDGTCSVGDDLSLCNVGGLAVYDDSCSDVNMECKNSNCGGFSASDGTDCVVTMGKSLGAGCAPAVVDNSGKWDASEGQCVQCADKKESRICADASSIRVDNNTWLCDSSDDSFEKGCDSSIDNSCDDKKEDDACNPPVGGKCDANGQCVVVSGLSLSASASLTTIATGGNSTITFTVTNTTGNVSGATVNGISVTVGGGSVSAGSCNTNASGECTVTYNAPAVSTVATIEAAKATKTGETDSGLANANVTVSSCTASTMVKFGSNNYDVGDPLDITWAIGSSEPDNNYIVCVYDENGSDIWDQNIAHFSGSANLGSDNSVTANAVGTWMASLSIGLSCATNGCIDSATVSVAGPGPCVPVISCVDSACLETTPTSAGFTSTCTNSCTGAVTTTTSACCLKDDHCAGGTPACNLVTEQCVECVVDDDCVGTDVCNNHLCTPCSGEGIDPGDAALCCFGLSYLDIDGDGTFACTSACDPNSWFFCNPLRGTVETIVQAGETMLGYILGLIGSIALLFIIIAGMMYMTSAGNEERISSSKKILTGAVIGLMIALLAYGMLHVIMTVLDMT